jgi:hypothetical protein
MKLLVKRIFAILLVAGLYPASLYASEKKVISIESPSEITFSGDTLQQKANINTSRSNIKHKAKPDEIGVNEPGVNRKEPAKGDGTLPSGTTSSKKKEKAQSDKK